MACILARGFEYGNIYDMDYYGSTGPASVTSGTKRPGGYSNYSLFMNSSSLVEVTRLYLPTAKSAIYLQMCFLPTVLSSQHLIKWKKGSTVLGSLYWDNTLKVWKLYTGDGASLVATGLPSNGWTVNNWYILELYINISDTGTLTCRINGLQDMTFSGDTKPGADTTLDVLEIPFLNLLKYYLDDIVINDTTGSAPGNTWPSGAYVTGLSPTGAGTTTQWTPSTGNNYACVDEIPPVGTDYVSVNAVDQIDSYTFADLPAAASVVLGVEVAIFACKIGISTPTTIKPLVRHSGTDYPTASGLTVPLLSTFPLHYCWAQNPGTGPADWTVANVNALEIGFESAA
jgi:hypothetical protein